MPPFYDAVGAQTEEKDFMLTTTPIVTYAVYGDTIHICTIPHPETNPDIKAEVDFKLGQEFNIDVFEHTLKVRFEWENGHLIQHMVPQNSYTLPHVVEHYISDGHLLQVFKVTEENGKVVVGTRRFTKKEET